METLGLILERTVEDPQGAGFSSDGTLNLLFVVAFALLISYLAMVIARRGGKRK